MCVVPARINDSAGAGVVADRSVVIGDSAELHCVADGTPRPSVQWTRDGHQISTASTSSGSSHANLALENAGQTLRVHSMQLVDIGAYQCHASNTAGNDTRQFLLNILGFSALLYPYISK